MDIRVCQGSTSSLEGSGAKTSSSTAIRLVSPKRTSANAIKGTGNTKGSEKKQRSTATNCTKSLNSGINQHKPLFFQNIFSACFPWFNPLKHTRRNLKRPRHNTTPFPKGWSLPPLRRVSHTCGQRKSRFSARSCRYFNWPWCHDWRNNISIMNCRFWSCSQWYKSVWQFLKLQVTM